MARKPAVELGQILDHKFIVFDTNIFVKALKHFETFAELLRSLKEFHCQAIYFPLIEFEFTRDAFIPEHKIEREEFLKRIGATRLSIRDDLIDSALEIAKIYSYSKIPSRQISLVDCCIAAYLKQFREQLFLLTLNHADFPQLLFDRIDVFALSAGDEVLAPAIYQFSINKWMGVQNKYNKVTNKSYSSR